jgi:putative copper resistance protein D
VLAGSYYRTLDRPYATDLMTDQHLGAGITWAMGEVPIVLVLAAILVQWFREDRREGLRIDRAVARSGHDEDLEQYNAYLARLAGSEDRRTEEGRAHEPFEGRRDRRTF